MDDLFTLAQRRDSWLYRSIGTLRFLFNKSAVSSSNEQT